MAKKKYVVFDIDGTLAELGTRLRHIDGSKKKDWDAFHNECIYDTPIKDVIELFNALYENYHIVLCTGRPEIVRDKTVLWLDSFIEKYNSKMMLLMRADNDKRPDEVIKPELLRKAGLSSSNVQFIIDDRDRVVAKWRELGFTCLQPRPGNY